MPEIHGEGVLGRKVEGATRQLDTFDLPSQTSEVDYTSDEVTSLCPITGQPDWYTVRVELTDARVGLESKSLKLYLQSWRDEGQFCEEFAATIAKDVQRATKANVRVVVTQKPRGGIEIDAVAESTVISP